MAAPIRLVRPSVSSQTKSSPDERASLLASLWLGHDGETVLMPVDKFVKEVARAIQEAEELAIS
jgi:hypothetical protein